MKRKKEKTEIICGLHAVRHALNKSQEYVLEIWVQRKRESTKEILDILKNAAQVPVQIVNKQALDTLTNHETHQGIAVRKKKSAVIQTLLDNVLGESDKQGMLLLVLDGVQDPHNLGACLRTADAVGVNAIVIPEHGSVKVNTTVYKVASGGAESVPVIKVPNLARALRQIQKAGLWIIGTTENAKDSLYDTDLNRPLALVMGAEGKGLRENIRKHCDFLVKIPMNGVVESLNVSVAAGVCLYECIRQRNCLS